MKIRFLAILAILAGLISPAYSAGTIPGMSLSQQFDSLGKPLAACKLYVFAAGTTTPQSVYQDSALTLPWPNPLTCDSAGRLPQLFAADGSIKIRLANSAGVTQVTADGILVVGASSGGGGGSPVDATTILATGDIKVKYGTGVLTGFVRVNGRTIGSATSGATERANSDCQALFEYLWGADANLSVSTGRGASANADWVANKTLTLPDGKGRTIAGMDDMGATTANRLNTALSSTTLGAVGGEQQHTLVGAEIPAHTHTTAGNTGVEQGLHSHSFLYHTTQAQVGGGQTVVDSIGTGGSAAATGTESATHTHDITSTTSSTGGSGGHNNVQPTIVMTFYMKL